MTGYIATPVKVSLTTGVSFDFNMRKFFVLVTFVVSVAVGARLRKDLLQDKFKQFYELQATDFHLEFTSGDGRAEFTLYRVFDGHDLKLRMSEDLFVFDTLSHPEIEMCNGTVEDLMTGQAGVNVANSEFRN